MEKFKFRIVTEQFGYPLYAAVIDGRVTGTDRAEEAAMFDERDNPEVKRNFWTDITGLDFTVEYLPA